jgi:putative zinc finger protein/FecR-like protein
VLGKGRDRKHPPDALLHAYVAGQVDPAQRAVISSHLETCESCRRAKARVEAIAGLFHEMQPADLDEMRWRRISQGVMSRLEHEARERRHGSWADVILRSGIAGSRTRLAALGAAVLAVIALAVWIVPRSISTPSQEAPESDRTIARERGVSTIATGQTPLAITLPSGVSLRLSSNARMLARSTVPPQIALDLEFGTLELAEFEPPRHEETITVRTPAFIATARRSEFTVGYEADRFFVSVRRGEATVEGDSLPKPRVVQASETLVLLREGATWKARDAQAAAEESAPTIPSTIAQRIERERTLLAKARAAEGGKEARPVKPESVEPAPTPFEESVHSSYEGDTRVQVEKPPEDPISKKWLEASAAYYTSHDDARAVALANDIIAEGGNRAEVGLAQGLLCEAYLTLKQPERAVAACKARIAAETDPESARMLHYQLGTIYRTQLHDCRAAIDHYSASMVFGRATTLDDESLVWRAHCALSLGDVDGAKRDIVLLERHSALLARPAELVELKKRLGALVSQKKSGEK